MQIPMNTTLSRYVFYSASLHIEGGNCLWMSSHIARLFKYSNFGALISRLSRRNGGGRGGQDLFIGLMWYRPIRGDMLPVSVCLFTSRSLQKARLGRSASQPLVAPLALVALSRPALVLVKYLSQTVISVNKS